MSTLYQDLRAAIKGLLRNRGFAAAVIATMALGIGANTAIFSVVYGVVLKPLPYDGGDRLLRLHAQLAREHQNDAGFSALELQDYRSQTQTLASIDEYHSMSFIFFGR